MEGRRIHVVAPDPAWRGMYAEEAARLKSVLGENVAALHHMGSTAVEGLWAKPIIDLFLQVYSLPALDAQSDALHTLGYTPLGEYGLPGRRYYPKGAPRTHHLHAYDVRNEAPLRHLHFRDYLRAHPDVCDAYGRLKRDCAGRFPADAEGYCDCKDAFVAEHEARAIHWHQEITSLGER